MVQRYVRSTHAGRALTLRVDVHKTPVGAWKPHRAAARVNVAGGYATNSAGGGAQIMIEKFLGRRSARSPDQIHQETVTIACQAAALIDREPTGSIIELGVDFALDPQDRLWIVETNVRPEANWAEQDRAIHIVAYLLSLVS
jgi:glutathione synthase/RimK-type ligase-like ATP-grasp enzyme